MDRRIGGTWLTRQHVLVAMLVLFLGVAGVIGYVAVGLSRSVTVARARVVISPVHEEIFREYLPVTGTVVPRDTTYLDIIEGGQVAEVFVEEGALVELAEPLLRLKNADLELEVIARQAQLTDQLKQLSGAQIAFEQTKLAHERELIELQFQIDRLSERLARQRTLFLSGVVSRADLDDIEADLVRNRRLRETVADARTANAAFQHAQLDQLQAAVQGMRKNLVIVRQSLESLILRAPISGQLTALDAHVGESKAPGQRVGQIDRADRYKAEALVDEFYLARVVTGQKATVRIDGEERRLEIVKVYPHVTDRRFKVDLAFAEAVPASVRRGQTVDVRLEIGAAKRSLVVANGPFYDDTGGRWAFVVSSSGDDAERRAITLGRRNPDTVEVVAGLSDGERIVTSGYENFKEFERIQLRGSAK